MGYLVDSSSHYILGSAFGTPRNGCVPNAVSSASEAPCEAPTLETLPRYRPARRAPGRARASSVRVFKCRVFGGACRRGQHIWWLLESTKQPIKL